MPIVSVIIPTYNRYELLVETLRSIQQQTFKDYEIILVDHGSTDGTADRVRRDFGDAVRVISLPNCPLPACPRNEGIRQAKGTYLAFVDSDDLWVPEKLAWQVAALEESQNAWCYGLADRFSGNLNNRSPMLGWWQVHSGQILSHLTRNNFIPSCTVMVRRDRIPEVGYFDETPALRAAEDYEYWVRWAARYPISLVRRTVAYYRISDSNLSANLFAQLKPARVAIRLFSRKLGLSSWQRRQGLAYTYLQAVRHAMTLKNIPQAQRYLKISLRFNPFQPRLWFYGLLGCFGPQGMSAWVAFERDIKKRISS